MDFSTALLALKSGSKLHRQGWNGRGMFIQIQLPDQNSANTLPYIFIRTVDGHRVPWVASQTDLLATDWIDLETEFLLGH